MDNHYEQNMDELEICEETQPCLEEQDCCCEETDQKNNFIDIDLGGYVVMTNNCEENMNELDILYMENPCSCGEQEGGCKKPQLENNSIDFDFDCCQPEIKADVIVNEYCDAVISGQIKNCRNAPIKNARVQLLKVLCICGNKEYKLIGETATNCRGSYRFEICNMENCGKYRIKICDYEIRCDNVETKARETCNNKPICNENSGCGKKTNGCGCSGGNKKPVCNEMKKANCCGNSGCGKKPIRPTGYDYSYNPCK